MDTLDNEIIHILNRKKQCNVGVLPVTTAHVYRLQVDHREVTLRNLKPRLREGSSVQNSGVQGLFILQQMCEQSSVGLEAKLCSPRDRRSMAGLKHTAAALGTRDPIVLT